MPQIVNDGKNLALVFDHETFPLAGVAELQDTYVFLTRDGRVFEIVMSHLPLAGQSMAASIFDVVSTVTPEGTAQSNSPFIPVIFDAAPESQAEAPQEKVENPAPEEQQEPETPKEETPQAEPEPAQTEPEPPAEEPQQEETPTEEPKPEPETPEQPEVETEVPAEAEEPQKERVADRVARGEQVPLMDMIDEIKADKAAGRTPDYEKGSKRKGKKNRPTASA